MFCCGIIVSITFKVCTYFPLELLDLVCTTGDLRLVGGSNPLEGRVEVCFFNQWGTICDTQWGTEEAEVACRQLGYTGTREIDS